MSEQQLLPLAAAICVLLVVFRSEIMACWSAVKNLRAPAAAGGRGPSYQKAMLDLAGVRLRLVETESLSADAAAAIEKLTLALLAGSDK